MKTLYALLGAPGVGKTTFIETVSQEIYGDNRLNRYVIGPDLIRGMVQSPVAQPDGTFGISQDNEGYVWSIVNDILDKKTEKGELIIVDATHSRNKAISNYKKYSDKGYRIVMVNFTNYASLDEIKRRNREREGYKFVPEYVIETMQERIEDMDLPGWVEDIDPSEFRDHLNDVKMDWSEFDDVTVIGDIHGCNDELLDTLRRAGIDPTVPNSKKAVVFVGDYFDRGPKIIEVFKTIKALRKNYYVLTLMGNHEVSLAFYKDFIMAFTEVTKKWIRSYLNENEAALDAATVAFCTKYEFVSYKKLDVFVEHLKEFPEAFEAFTGLVYGYKFELRDNIFVNKSARNAFRAFLLSDIVYTEVSDFYKRLAQLCYVDYRGQDIVVTHGGLADLPSKLTPTSDMVRGVGGYTDTLECDEQHYLKNPNVISIHGHRNSSGIPIMSTDMTYNINGDVDLGMRAVVINKDMVGKEMRIKTITVAPKKETITFYREKQIRAARRRKAHKLNASEEGSGDTIRLFQDHKHVNVKKLPGNIASVNFTQKAFARGHWDEVTIKARGLFLDISDNDVPRDIIVARGYEKFFNLGERYGVSQSGVRHQVFPILTFEKANGYLGLLSVDNRDPENPTWFTASKTTTQGEYADVFRSIIEPQLNDELMQEMIQQNITLVFEVIHPVFDPHIQTYSHPELVLLDAIHNQLEFSKVDFQDLPDILNLITPGGNTRIKRLVTACQDTADFGKLIHDLNFYPIFDDSGEEGYVFETTSGEGLDSVMFKCKSDWYSFWKRVRSQRDKIVNRLIKHKNRGDEVVLTKSELVNLKGYLHTAEEIKAFRHLVTLAEKDPQRVKELSIPSLRQEIIKMVFEENSTKTNNT